VVGASLVPDPPGWVVIPVVAGIGDLTQGGFDLVPPTLVVQAPPDQLGDELASSPRPGAAVELGHQLVIQRYV
jgi:hypothetical protein